MEIDNVNNVGLVVRDLHDITRRFEALGFTLTPYAAQSGA